MGRYYHALQKGREGVVMPAEKEEKKKEEGHKRAKPAAIDSEKEAGAPPFVFYGGGEKEREGLVALLHDWGRKK